MGHNYFFKNNFDLPNFWEELHLFALILLNRYLMFALIYLNRILKFERMIDALL